jgi:hypothetical protein
VLNYQGIHRSKTICRQKATMQLREAKKQKEKLAQLPTGMRELQKQLEHVIDKILPDSALKYYLI